MTARSSYNLTAGEGNIIVNISLVKNSELPEAVNLLYESYTSGYTMGELITLFEPGKRILKTAEKNRARPGRSSAAGKTADISVNSKNAGDRGKYAAAGKTGAAVKAPAADFISSSAPAHIPWGYTGIGTVSSINVNSILLKKGIPVKSVFGGILEISENSPVRFLEIIKYGGTSIDPLEIFIKGGMTDISGVLKSGSGRIGASFIEFPESCRKKVVEINSQIEGEGPGRFICLRLARKRAF